MKKLFVPLTEEESEQLLADARYLKSIDALPLEAKCSNIEELLAWLDGDERNSPDLALPES